MQLLHDEIFERELDRKIMTTNGATTVHYPAPLLTITHQKSLLLTTNHPFQLQPGYSTNDKLRFAIGMNDVGKPLV